MSGLVYFIGCQKIGAIKIGYSSGQESFKSRMVSHQVSFPNKLEVFAIIKFSTEKAARDAEGMLHAAMRYYRTNGEWFRIEGACKVLLDEVVRGRNESLECSQYDLAMVSAILTGKKSRVKEENNKDDTIELLSYICLVQSEQIARMNTAHSILAEQFSRFDSVMTDAIVTRVADKARRVGGAAAMVMNSLEDNIASVMDFDSLKWQSNLSDDEISNITGVQHKKGA